MGILDKLLRRAPIEGPPNTIELTAGDLTFRNTFRSGQFASVQLKLWEASLEKVNSTDKVASTIRFVIENASAIANPDSKEAGFVMTAATWLAQNITRGGDSEHVDLQYGGYDVRFAVVVDPEGKSSLNYKIGRREA